MNNKLESTKGPKEVYQFTKKNWYWIGPILAQLGKYLKPYIIKLFTKTKKKNGK